MGKLNSENKTSCCDAYSTYMDDGLDGWVECCKACYHEITEHEGVAR
jgi:hypothetical protein